MANEVKMTGNVITITLDPLSPVMRSIDRQQPEAQATLRQYVVNDMQTGVRMLERFGFSSQESIDAILDPEQAARDLEASNEMLGDMIAAKRPTKG